MGIESFILLTTLALTAAGTVYSIIKGKDGNEAQTGEEQEFKATMAREGSVVRWICGRGRYPANLIWYDNVRAEAIEQETGGKGFASPPGDSTQGWRIYCDAWQSICLGKATIIETYVNDKPEPVLITGHLTNDGTETTAPPIDGGNKIKGVCWWYVEGWYLGDNAYSMPNVHFVVERELETPLPYQNLPNGSNPAAAVYDLLTMAGAVEDDFDTASFIKSSEYYSTQGIGLNLSIDKQVTTKQAIEKLLKYLDAVFYENAEGKFAFMAIDPAEAFVMTLEQSKMKGFSLNRKTWKQVPNFFTANFTDEDQEFTNRSVSVPNPAALRLAGKRIPATIDYKCFRDLDTVSLRLWETMKRRSYPAATVKFKYDLTPSELLPGQVIRISNSHYGIVNADFRIDTIDAAGIDKNEIGITATQQSETLFDDNFEISGGTEFEPPDTDPVALNYTRIFELPYNSRTEFAKAYLVLAAREKLNETKFVVLYSDNPTQGYKVGGSFTSWAMRGTLDANYTADTFSIDDRYGIDFSFYQDDPVFDSVTRAQLFSTARVALINNELVAFQTITATGPASYRLTGIVREILETPRESHLASDEIWLTNFSQNILTGVNLSSFYTKIVPYFLNNSADIGAISPVLVTSENKALKPWFVGRIMATRVGSNITFQLWPRTPGYPGSGVANTTITDSSPPFEFAGDFQVEYDSTTIIKSTDSFIISYAGDVDFTVKSRLNGFISDGITITVLAGDGEYYA